MKANRVQLYILLLSIFLFKIPNFYLLIIFQNSFLTSQAIARILLGIVFLYTINSYFKNKKQQSLFFSSSSTKIIFAIFIIQSLSVVSASNISSFWLRYKDIIIGFLAYIVFFAYRKEYLKIIYVYIGAAVINVLYQVVAFFSPSFYINTFSHFIYQKHADLVIANLKRSRIYIDTYDEVIIPFLLFGLWKKKFEKLFFPFLFLCIAFFAFVSNFRSRILMLFFSCIGFIVVRIRINAKNLIIFFLCILGIGLIANSIVVSMSGYSYIDRLVFSSTSQDIDSITNRVKQIDAAFEMGRASIFGVGLGNYYDRLDSRTKKITSYDKWKNIESQGFQEYVHNSFGSAVAETGYLGLFFFALATLIFMKNDVKILQKNNELYKKALVIGFWVIYIFGLLNPTVPVAYQVLFWGLRGLLA